MSRASVLPTGNTSHATGVRVPKRESIDQRTRERIAGHLKAKMSRMNWTQADVARMLGVNSGTVSRILDGRSLGLDVFIKINRRCGIDAEMMLNSDPKPNV